MRLIYGILALIYGVFFLVVTFAWRRIPLAFLQAENAVGITFAVSVIMFIPFVITYTKLGFNSAEGEEPSPETKARHAALKRECPIWRITWYGCIGFVLFVWIGFATVQLPANPFFALSGMMGCVTGVWFLFAYPIATGLHQP